MQISSWEVGKTILASITKVAYVGLINYFSGVNIAYESVGGKLLDSTIDNLATGGKCISIGFIENYQVRKTFSNIKMFKMKWKESLHKSFIENALLFN